MKHFIDKQRKALKHRRTIAAINSAISNAATPSMRDELIIIRQRMTD